MSRFDLIFILLDRPGAELDFHLSKKILSRGSSVSSSGKIKSIKELQEEAQASSRFAPTSTAPEDLLPIGLLRQYIAFAQQAIHPRLSPDAKAVLKDFYLESRRQRLGSGADKNALPVTTRQLEAAIRLSEAKAKAELRQTVLKEDAEEIVDLM